MKINQYLNCKIKILPSDFAHSKKNIKYSFDQYTVYLKKMILYFFKRHTEL